MHVVSNQVQAVSINEFHAPRWSATLYSTDPPVTLGREVLGASDLDGYGLFVLIGIGALVCFIMFYNLVIVLCMKYLSCECLPLFKPTVLHPVVLRGNECQWLARRMLTTGN